MKCGYIGLMAFCDKHPIFFNVPEIWPYGSSLMTEEIALNRRLDSLSRAQKRGHDVFLWGWN